MCKSSFGDKLCYGYAVSVLLYFNCLLLIEVKVNVTLLSPVGENCIKGIAASKPNITIKNTFNENTYTNICLRQNNQAI